jgi:hypothetical protein
MRGKDERLPRENGVSSSGIKNGRGEALLNISQFSILGPTAAPCAVPWRMVITGTVMQR